MTMFSFAHGCSTIIFKAQVALVACNIEQHNMNIIKIKQSTNNTNKQEHQAIERKT